MTLPEALTLAVLPQSPSYRLEPKTGVLGAALTQARNRLFQRWQRVYPTDASQQTLFRLPLALRQPEQVPYIAPHFIEQLRQQTQQLVQRDTRVDTTLDAGLQRLVERQVNAFIARNRSRGIKTPRCCWWTAAIWGCVRWWDRRTITIGRSKGR